MKAGADAIVVSNHGGRQLDGASSSMRALPGALGEAGVTRMLQIVHKELDVTMAFCGHTDIRQVGRDILVAGTFPTTADQKRSPM